uniref:NADH-ubiquinone oxidoreductase chain 4 n=1 Tax=Spongiobothrium sp. MZUSP 7999 TaxID=2899502 RepID=A0A8K1SY67_9CEST|nr:NADH dehydrogenase subunit 4 [Spongiobothrium sp. MZUSP 7999]
MSVYNFFSPSFFLGVLLCSLTTLFFSNGVSLSFIGCVSSGLFMFDSLSFYLVILVVFLGSFSLIGLRGYVSLTTISYLLCSLLFSGLSFCVNHAILFWCFYELSMLPLLLLIFKDSPYSERFIAGWYFAVYLLVTSLPLILSLLYLSFKNSSLLFSEWCVNSASISVYVCLSFIFFTKVPLGPFHTWLPIVHAEATSIVSIFLSGYIMKLGLLGVFRCSAFIFNTSLFFYLFFCFVLSICFILTASAELDGKRWLAFLSLSHIVVSFLAFYSCGWDTLSLSFIFCLGHGLSAGLVFGVLWLFYDISGSRNWLLLKEGAGGPAALISVVMSMLSLCSFPPTLQFFCEVNLLSESVYSYIFIVFWSLYLFFGGLIPLILCGHSLIRLEATESSVFNSSVFFLYFFFLGLWCYLGIFIF